LNFWVKIEKKRKKRGRKEKRKEKKKTFESLLSTQGI